MASSRPVQSAVQLSLSYFLLILLTERFLYLALLILLE